MEHPAFWKRAEILWMYRAMFGEVRLAAGLARLCEPRGSHGIRKVAWASSCRAKSNFTVRLMGRARAGVREPIHGERTRQARRHGNFDFKQWDPAPTGSHPDGASAFGVHDLVGNGWEWTRTQFAPFPGFVADALLPRLFREFLRWQTLRDEGRVVANGCMHVTAIFPELVPAALSVRLRDIPLRGRLALARRTQTIGR